MPEPLHVEPGAGHHAAALCDDAAAALAGCATDLDEDPLRRLLEQHADNLSGFAARFRAVDGAYRDADTGGADPFR